METIVDTDIFVAADRGRLNLPELLTSYSERRFYISVITASELLHGVHRANEPKIRARREAFVEAILVEYEILEIDLRIGRIRAQISSGLESTGQIIGPNDLWIGKNPNSSEIPAT